MSNSPAFKIVITWVRNGSTEQRTSEEIYSVGEYNKTVREAYTKALARWHHIHNVITNRKDTLISGSFSRI